MHTLATAALIAAAPLATAGTLVDYGAGTGFNDAGVVRGLGTPTSPLGFGQFQSIAVTDEAWRLDSASLRVSLWNVIAGGDAELAFYAADGHLPDHAAPVSATFDLSTDSLTAETVTVGLGGDVVLTRGTWYVGLTAADPLTEILWHPGTAGAPRHTVRSDGQIYTYYNPALSLTLDGAVVPAAPAAAALAVIGLAAARRRR